MYLASCTSAAINVSSILQVELLDQRVNTSVIFYLGWLDSGEALFLIGDIAFLLCPHEVNGGERHTDRETERSALSFPKNFKPIIGFPTLTSS